MESRAPFFSIVIPTKNRPVLLRDAIQSVLWQDYTDFELIVSDNHNDENTEAVLHEFRSFPQVKIIKPSHELKMIDHWEFATKHAVGEYVILLADRKVLYQGALKKLRKITRKYPEINAFSVGVQTYDEVNHKMGWCNTVGKTKRWKSSELVANFLGENLFVEKSFDIYFPKTLNGMYKNTYAKQVRFDFGQYFNTPGVTTPDYSSFFINTALNEEVVYVGKKIILTQGEQSSNGRNFGAGKFHAYMDSLGYDDPYQYVPIKAPIIYNLLTIDYLAVQAICKRRNATEDLNLSNYYSVNYFEILNKREQGLDEAVFAYFEESWNQAISTSPIHLEAERVKAEALEAFKNKNKPMKNDKIKRFSYHAKDFLAARFSKDSFVNRVVPFEFRDVFHAAGFKQLH